MNTQLKRYIVLCLLCVLAGCQTTGGSKPVERVAPDPKAAEINVKLGLGYLRSGDYEVALGKLEKALQQNPNLPSAHNTIAMLYQRLSQFDEAEQHFEEAVQRAPTYSEAQNNFGVFLCQQKRYEEAETRFVKATENPLYVNAAQAFENAGMCMMRADDLDKAEVYFRKALQKNKSLPKSLLQMANLNYEQADYIEANTYIKRYKAVAAWRPQSLLTAIKVAKKLGDQDAVASYILLLKAKFPDSDEAGMIKRGDY